MYLKPLQVEFKKSIYLLNIFYLEQGDRRTGSRSGIISYSVMQSDGNSFCGDVILDSFNISYRDEG